MHEGLEAPRARRMGRRIFPWRRRNRRGAALVMAVAILAIIIAIAVAFFSTSRVELNIATNVANTARADMISNAGLAMGMAFLNHDLLAHSTYTSLDFAAFSYFDGSWVAGKRWAFANGQSWRDRMHGPLTGHALSVTPADMLVPPAGGTPYINLDMINSPLPFEGPFSPAFSGNSGAADTSAWLYIPRLQAANAPLNFQGGWTVDPQYTDTRLVYRKQIIHGWADVDSDGDGFRDAMWIPVPADLIVGNRDVNGDGRVDYLDSDGDGLPNRFASADILGDGIDNNLNNGQILNSNRAPDAAGVLVDIDDNLDGAANDGNDGVDEIGETAQFLYIGAADGLDNDGDGVIDNIEEGITADGRPIVWQTVPLPGVNTQAAVVYPHLVAEAISAATGVTVASTNVQILVDQIDNDYDLIANNGFALAFDLNDYPQARNRQDAIERLIPLDDPRVKGMSQIAENYTGARAIVFARGEPATEVIGRVAVLVKDVAGQVNLNTAGGHRFVENSAQDPAQGVAWGGSADSALWPGNTTVLGTGSTAPSYNQGLGPQEYLTSAIPGVGAATSRALWQDLVGAPDGLELAVSQAVVGQFDLDMVRPGFGGADDNGSALWMAMDGLDNDGDGFVDEGLNPAYPELFGQFEGIDEPGEFRTYRPQRNPFAENDGIDNDNDGLIDELGELGDGTRRSEDGAMQVARAITAVVPGNSFNEDEIEQFVRDAATIHSSDKDMRHQQRVAQVLNAFTTSLDDKGRIVPAPPMNRGITGLKLDFNYTAAPRIAEALRRDWAYDQPPTFLRLTGGAQYITGEQGYAAGLRSEGIQWFNDGDSSVNPDSLFFVDLSESPPSGISSWPDRGLDFNSGPDRELRAAQLAANTQDYRDADSAQTRVTTAKNDDWWQSLTGDLDGVGIGDGERRPIVYTQAGSESIRINEIMVRPTRRIEAEMVWGENAPVVTNNGANNWTFDLRQNFDPDAAYPVPQVVYTEPLTGTAGAEFRVLQGFMTQQLGFPVDFRLNGFVAPALGGLGWQTPWEYIERFTNSGNGGYADNAANNGPFALNGLPEPPTTYAMGGSAALMTAVASVGGDPNAVMFEFRPSPSLPPGRYYLTLNTMLDTRIPYSATVTDPAQIRVITKYVSNDGSVLPSGATTGTTSILRDFQLAADPFTDVPEAAQVVIGGPGGLAVDDPEDGNLFVATRAVRTSPLNPAHIPGYEQDTAYAVEIPPYSGAGVDWRLQVSVYFVAPFTPAVKAINYFEFSQEPDHEWVEVVNIAEADSSLPLELQAIDLSGWELEVGTGGENPQRYEIPDGTTIAPGGMLLLAANKSDRYDERSFDLLGNFNGSLGNFADPDTGLTTLGAFYRNGIGMTAYNGRNHAVDAFNVLKTPYVFNESNITSFPHFPPLDPATGLPMGDDLGLGRFHNLFWRRNDIDLIDYTGNSVRDDDAVQDPGMLLAHYMQDTPAGPARLLRDNLIRSTIFDNSGYGATGNLGNKAYDRVVQLISTELDAIAFNVLAGIPESPDTVIEEIAEVVLRGGIFPNYPERDGIDNDGDSARVRGELANDRLDNDGDGLVDEAEEFGIDLNGNDDPSTLVGTSLFATAFLFDLPEGVDENRWPLGVPSAEAGSPARAAGLQGALYSQSARPQPGSYQRHRGVLSGTFPNPMSIGIDGSSRDGWITTEGYSVPQGQPGSSAPPAWKAFVEKRFYPGDAVKVTLYVGSADAGRIADQITYTELDVTNRAIHDGVDCLQGALTYNLNTSTYGSRTAALDVDNIPFWPADSMGLDFYRSLERRHPLWHGDLAGTTNRWQPTDGAYDDWDASRTPAQLAVAGADWWNPAGPSLQQIQLFAHQFGGSPLRQNFWHRMTDNPGVNHDLAILAGNDTRFNTQFGFDGTGPEMDVGYAQATFNPLNVLGFPLTVTAALSPYSPERRWTLTRSGAIRNRTLASPADLVRMPAMTINRSVYGAASAGLGGPFVDGLRSVLLGEGDPIDSIPFGSFAGGGNFYAGVQSGNPDELTALVNSGASSPLVLSVAQADVMQLGNYGNRGVNWDFNDTVNGEAPLGWAPVFLFPILNDANEFAPAVYNGPQYTVPGYALSVGQLPGQAYDLDAQFLFRNNSGGGATNFVMRIPGTNGAEYDADRNARWTMRTRSAMFVSGNLPGFNPFSPAHNEPGNQGAEALFMWDGADGLENGEYDLYLVTAEPVDALIRANDYQVNVLNREPMLSDFALNVLLPRVSLIDPSELPVDVEVFTDRNGNNTVLRDDFDLSAAIDPELALDRGQNPALGQGDSFGMQTGLTPGTDGVVHYGVVKVENNVLGVMIRNWADRGKINRFSRVVLTPRNKTRGRININTATANPTDRTDFGAAATAPEDFNPTRGLPGLWMRYRTGTPYFAQPFYPYPGLNEGDVAANGFDPNPLTPLGEPANPNRVARLLSKSIDAGRRIPVADATNTPVLVDWTDGRYYRHPTDLFAFSQELALPNGGGTFATVKAWNTGLLSAGYAQNLLNNAVGNEESLLARNSYAVFDESTRRLSRMYNLITTRSDTFELYVTAQSGYLAPTDQNNDGAIDYRSDFVSTGEKTVRVVYER